MKRILSILASVLALAACSPSSVTEEQFLSFDVPTVVYNGKVFLSYNENSCQTALNPDRGEFRLMKDNLTEYFSVRLGTLDLKTGDEVKGDAVWSEPEDLSELKNTVFKVLKTDGNLAWIKSEHADLRLVILISE